MTTAATHEDANLLLRLYDLRREETMRTARKWMAAAPQFTSREHWLSLCPPGTNENAYYRQVTTYWDMASSFVVNGILDRQLFYRSNTMELMFVWEKVKKLVPELRAVQGFPLILRNMEDVAGGFIEFLNENAPGYYETFAANIAKIGVKPPPAADKA
jgi:hypothetical protein